MAVEDLVRVYTLFKELVLQGGIDLSYYLVVFGVALIGVTATFIIGLVLYRLLNTAANADTAGLLKITFILATILLVAGVIMP